MGVPARPPRPRGDDPHALGSGRSKRRSATLTRIAVPERPALKVALAGTDPHGDTLTYSAQAQGNQLTIAPQPGYAGTFVVIASVSDNNGGRAGHGPSNQLVVGRLVGHHSHE